MKLTQYERYVARRRAGCKRHDSVPVVCVEYPSTASHLEQAPYIWGYRFGRKIMADGYVPVTGRYISVGRRWLDQALKDAEPLDLVAARRDAENRRSNYDLPGAYGIILSAIGRRDTRQNNPLQAFLDDYKHSLWIKGWKKRVSRNNTPA